MADPQVKIVVSAVDKASAQINNITKTAGSMAKGLLTAAAGVVGFGMALGKATEFMKGSVTAASNLSETVNKTKVIFGKAADAIIDKSDEVSESMGMSSQSFLDAASTFGVFGKSAGLADEGLAKFSTDLTGLAADMASFSNTSPEEAILAIGAALRGESEPIRRYGVLLDDASLRQQALEMNIISTTKNALTPQQRVLAAQALIFKQTADAQGDFARTSDGLANTQKILKAEIENLKVEIGTALIPTVTEVTSNFVDFVQILNGTYDAAKHTGGGLSDLKNTLNDLMIEGRLQAEQLETLTTAYELGLISVEEYKDMQRKLEYSSKDLSGAMTPIEDELNDLYVAANSLGNSELNLINIHDALTSKTEVLTDATASLTVATANAALAILDLDAKAMGMKGIKALDEAYVKGAISEDVYKVKMVQLMDQMLGMDNQSIQTTLRMGELQKQLDSDAISAAQYADAVRRLYNELLNLDGTNVNTTITQTYQQTGSLYSPGKSKGANFIVPPGYPNDSYPMRVESGEHVIVVPKSGTTTNNSSFTMNVHTNAPYSTLMSDYYRMKAMAG